MSDLQVLLVGYGAWAGAFLLLGIGSTCYRGWRRRGRGRPATRDYQLRARLKRLARPTLLLFPARSPGFSKLGGHPELPPDVPWPIGEDGPLTFVAQLDLGAFQPYGEFAWLPRAGSLFFFFDDARNGDPNCGVLLFSRGAPGAPQSPPVEPPKHRRFAERRVGFMKLRSFPSPDWLNQDLGAVDWESWDFAREADFGDEIEHRLGGYPSEIQGGQMALECECLRRGRTLDYRDPVPAAVRHAARQWRLLLQIDSDPALGMNWWDDGRIYVFVRARDAKRGDFSRTVTITQTH